MTTRYSRSMTTAEAIQRGMYRGVQMGINPDPTHLRTLSEQARTTDHMAEAWKGVGESLWSSMTKSSSSQD